MAVLAALTLMLLGSSKGRAQENDYRIVTAQRIGRFELGKPVDAFNLGAPTWQWRHIMREGLPFINAAFFLGPNISLFTCKSDGIVLLAEVSRRLDRPDTDGEVLKYKTAEGIGIGTDGSELLRVLGRPSSTREWSDRHGSLDIRITNHQYSGLAVRVNQADRKVLAVAVEVPGAWGACEQAIRTNPSLAQAGVPLPANVRVVPPASGVPPEIAAFSGKWIGVWEGLLDHVLIVEEVSSSAAAFVYAWGTAPQWGILRSGWVRVRGTVSSGDLQGRLEGANALVTYRRGANDTLTATYELSTGTSRATMVRLRD